MASIRGTIRQKQQTEQLVARQQANTRISQATHGQLTDHRSKWNRVVNKFTRSSIETRQAMIMSRIEELQAKKRNLEKLLDKRHHRSARSLDVDARIRASASQNYFIVADHLHQISRSLERADAERKEFGNISRVQKFVKRNTEAIESKCKVFDSKVLDFVSDLVRKKEEEKELILKKAAVSRRKSLERLGGSQGV